MVETLDDTTLKSGERVQTLVVRGPDADWRQRISRLLGHKEEIWLWQNTELLTHPTAVDAWFYVLHRNGVPFAHIMTAEFNGVGIFGHVWTEPADRGQGAAGRLMNRQMTHFRSRGGRALFLNTHHDSAAYHLYRQHGFEPIEPKSGTMVFTVEKLTDFESGYFACGEVRIAPLAWQNWPAAPALFSGAFPGLVRCAPLKLFGRKSPEGELLPWLQAPRPPAVPAPHVFVATLPNGAVVGLAAWTHDPLSPGFVSVDVFCHPRFWSHGPALLDEAVKHAPPARLAAYADTLGPQKQAVLSAAGFRVVTRWPRRLAVDPTAADFADLILLERDPRP